MDGFTENNQNKIKMAEWKGYTIKTLEYLTEETKEIKEHIADNKKSLCKKFDTLTESINRKIDKTDQKVNTLQMKVFGISSVLSLVVAIIFRLLFG